MLRSDQFTHELAFIFTIHPR